MASSLPRSTLVRPSPHVPWDVSVIHEVPQFLQEEVVSKEKVAVYDSYQNIQAIMSTDGKISLIKRSTTAASSTSIIYQTLYHPLLNRSEALLLSMSGDDESYFVFALNASTGYLAAWWLPRSATPSLLAKTPSCKLRFSSTADAIVLLKAVGSSLFMGSETGQLWCCTISARPMVITATEWTRTNTSLWNRMFSSTPTRGKNSTKTGSLQSPMVAFLPVRNKNNEVFHYSILRSGDIEVWHLEAGRQVCRLQDLLEDAVEDSFDGIEVLHASSSMASPLLSGTAATTTAVDIIVKILRRRRARMYYVQYADEKLQQCHWLNRFPDSVPCHGIISCDNGIAYACFGSSPVTVLALGGGGSSSSHSNSNNTPASPTPTMMIHEVDLPLDEAPAILGMGNDMETHGISVLTVRGLVLRVRWMQLQAVVVSTSDEEVHVLARHLRVAFWNYYQMKNAPLPPSLTASNTSSWTTPNMEAAIVVAARNLQREGDGSSSHNCLEWHLAFLRLLKEAGWYKNLSSAARWALLGIGQELAIHSTLICCKLFPKELPPYGLATKMTQVQLHVLNHSPTMEWSLALHKVLEAAMQYRESHAITTYDVLTDPRHLWTHELQDTLLLQLKHPEITKVETLDVIVTAALQVHGEMNSKDYNLVKSLGIDLIRNIVQNDKLAYDLSLQHAYYEGLCQLAIDKPNEFSLDPILSGWDDDFSAFALVWFAQQGHHDKALLYGKSLPDAFRELVDTHLHEYKWVDALRQKDYGRASDALFQNATGHDMEYSEWNLSMAKLTAKVKALEGKSRNGNYSASDNAEDKAGIDRLNRIDNKLDLMKAQRALIHDDDHVPLQTPEYLLKLAFERFDAAAADPAAAAESEQIIYYAMMGLIIANAGANRDGIATVWSKVIAVDMVDKWSVFIKSTPPPSRATLLQDTLFGQLWTRVQEQEDQESSENKLFEPSSMMQYHVGLEDLVLRKLTSLDRGAARELKRLLSRAMTMTNTSRSILAGEIEEQ